MAGKLEAQRARWRGRQKLRGTWKSLATGDPFCACSSIAAFWPSGELHVLIERLGREARLADAAIAIPKPPDGLQGAQLAEWIMAASGPLNSEIEPFGLDGSTLKERIRSAAPAIVETPEGFLALLRARGAIGVLTPSGKIIRSSVEDVCKLVSRHAERLLEPNIEAMLDRCGIPIGRRQEVRSELLRQRLSAKRIGALWQLRRSRDSGLLSQLSGTGLIGRLVVLLASHTIEMVLFLASWYVIGQGALAGHLELAQFYQWSFLLLCIAPFRMLTMRLQGQMAIGLGRLLKQRLLAGALNLDPAILRSEGAGILLGRTLESERVESLALSGGLTALLSIIDLGLTIWILTRSDAGYVLVPLFLFALAVVSWLTASYRNKRNSWTDSRLKMTHELVEKMTGHRTRLAQQSPEYWHVTENQQFETYEGDSVALDRHLVILSRLAPRAWLLIGLIVALFHSGSAALLAVGLGGVMSGYQSLRRLVQGLVQLAGAQIAWRQVQPMFEAAPIVERPSKPYAKFDQNGGKVVETHGLSFEQSNGRWIINGAELAIHDGDKILLEGDSGSGKSTLTSLLCGLKSPASGRLVTRGISQEELGIGAWRKHIACAPQYHENHLLSAPLLFNLLMGRHWPPAREDVVEATEVCDELGLGSLLQQMPEGISQMVGETGWQLSQGERSRVFLARALLQQGDLVILDESFAALDPENLRAALECCLRRATTILIVAHP